jgi:NitT/TauT family transport system ATP-binding protein
MSTRTATVDAPVQERELRNVVAAAPAAVRVEGVSQVFERGRPPVLEGLDLTVAAGEFVCLVGASGCGKSTLLNLIAGLTEPTSGRISVTAERPALMFQEPALLPWLTASGNVELALRARGVGRAERRAEAERLLRVVNLEGHSGKRVHELSGGMRQRVALARALAARPAVVVADEITSALDVSIQGAVLNLVRELQRELGLSILFISHNLAVVRYVAAHVAVMRRGEIVEQGPTGRVLAEPGHEYTRELLAAVPRRRSRP